ncbi:MAG TPA: GntR family transcriptional regulator [Pseudonocardiaceae bacterium]|jgi:GntR family transcriptional regulator
MESTQRRVARRQPGAPKYLQIQRDLTRRISRGEFRVHEALPAQSELSREYGVSTMTLRQALQHLEDQGLIEQVAGKGTYVRRHRIPYAATGLGSLADDLRAQGIALDTRVLNVDMTETDDRLAASLGLRPRDRVLLVERLRVLDGVPVVHQRSYLPEPFGTTLRDADFTRESLYDLLADRCGAIAVRATETMTPVVVPDPIAAALDVPSGALGLLSERLTTDSHELPLVADIAMLAGDRVVVTTERVARSNTLRYRVTST